MTLRTVDLSKFCKSLHVSRKAVRPFLVLIALALPAGTAWSFAPFKVPVPEKTASAFPNDHARDSFYQVPTSTNADECLPLLTSIHHTSPTSALDRNQRSAGQIAVLGLLFGVRLAPGPLEKAGKETSETLLDVGYSPDAVNGNRSALAVALYRDCRKEVALKSLSQDFRWRR
ncbi:MAG: hypothetical protein H6858_08275 [Rhodospirillales bacterium]|nr:hypothetical protein [Alphaproteobacteria bacterium]MCB9977576.1 hypothetical protein [Rhodospirillales bacterium]